MTQENFHSPNIFVTPRAILQWRLILENDFTLNKETYLRIQIDGKGCDGFTYATGFTEKEDNDLLIPIDDKATGKTFHLLMDPFAVFYLQEATLDYIQDFTQNLEGFIVVNHHQDQFHGKFWTDDPSKIPPFRSET